MAKTFLGRQDLPRGLRNNNAGNLTLTKIKWQGKILNEKNTDGRFEQFESVNLGLRAMAMDIINDIEKKKLNTLKTLITEYAPPAENDTAAYINRVSKATGINPNEEIKINAENLAAIIAAKIEVENGKIITKYINRADIVESINLLPAVILRRLKGAIIENKNVILPLVAILAATIIFLKK
jgi:hypothetical protein